MSVKKLTTTRKMANIFSQQGRNINNLAMYGTVKPNSQIAGCPAKSEGEAFIKELKDGSKMLKIYETGGVSADRTYIVYPNGSFDNILPSAALMRDNCGKYMHKSRRIPTYANGTLVPQKLDFYTDFEKPYSLVDLIKDTILPR